MQDYKKEMDIINQILGEEGLLRYNAIKNRFATGYLPNPPALLHFYQAENTSAADVDATTISSYRSNLQRLRRKIEERKVRTVEIIKPDSSKAVTETSETLTERTEDTVVAISPRGTQTPITMEPSFSSTPLPSIIPLNIAELNTLEHFQMSSAVGQVKIERYKKKVPATLQLDGTQLTCTVTNKKGEPEILPSIEITLSNLFLIVNGPKKFFNCFGDTTKLIMLKKEIDIISISKKKTAEIILRNTNTGSFAKESLNTLLFCIKDIHNQITTFEIQDSNEFIRWLLLLKTRIHTVDLWKKEELLETIRK
ncbi:hypothetical protein NEOKW01_1378 [Nematocida sp. AWRm80]|nr:hypothetical protein NEOKW01_1378 [Nematocida sp. AWRm80]